MGKRVAVVGGGVGGLVAAGELARAGHAVTLFEAGRALGGKAARLVDEGFTLDCGPTLLTLPSVVKETFSRLGANDLLPRFHRLTHQSRYRFHDDCVFDAYEDLEKSKASARELRPSEAKGLENFYAEAETIWRAAGEPYLEVPYSSFPTFLARVTKKSPRLLLKGATLGTLAELSARHFKTDHLRQFVNRFATYAGCSPYASSAAFAMIAHLERAHGVHHVEGGMGALALALAAAVRRLGVTVRENVRAQWKREKGEWRVGPLGEGDAFDAVVVNADPLASLGRNAEPLATSGYVLLLKANRRVELPHHTVLFSSDYAKEFKELFGNVVPSEPTVYICHPSATEPSLSPEGKSGLFVMVNAPAFRSPAEAEQWQTTHALRLKDFCLHTLKTRCPELKKAELSVWAERTPLDFAAHGSPGGSLYGFLPHGKMGPFKRPALEGDQPGLFFAGGGTHPGGGVPLVMLSGRFAASLAESKLSGKPKAFSGVQLVESHP